MKQHYVMPVGVDDFKKMKISLYVPNRHIQGYFYSATYHEPKIWLHQSGYEN